MSDGEAARAKVSLSVVVPVYQAEGILPELEARLRRVLEATGRTWEVLFVDDGSRDGSWRVIEALARQAPDVTAVKLSRNFGQHHAITAGLDLARGDLVVVMDCDLQDPPEAIPRLLEKAAEGHDVVLARRQDRKDGAFKRLGGRLYYRLFAWLSGRRLDPTVGSFRVMRRVVVDALGQMRETSRAFGALVDWLGFDVATVEVEHAARPSGTSSYSVTRLVGLSLDGLVSFSNRPLIVSIGVGLVLALAAGIYGLVLIGCALFTSCEVAGWRVVGTLVAFLGGLILASLGILGLYVGRIYDQVKGRPLYVVDEIVGGAEETLDS